MQTASSTDTASPPPKPRKRHKPNLMATAASPPPNAANLPPYIARIDTPPILYAVLGFRVSLRTLESWPVPTKRVNGKAMFETVQLFDYVQSKLDAAPIIQGGRTPAPPSA